MGFGWQVRENAYDFPVTILANEYLIYDNTVRIL